MGAGHAPTSWFRRNATVRIIAMSESPETGSIIDELEASLASGSVRHRLKVLQRVSDLFVAGSSHYTGAEIALFDDVLTRVAAAVEVRARAQLARRMARLADAPAGVLSNLAFDVAYGVRG